MSRTKFESCVIRGGFERGTSNCFVAPTRGRQGDGVAGGEKFAVSVVIFLLLFA